MNVVLAGVPFEVVPDDRLSVAERRALLALSSAPPGLPERSPFVIELLTDAPDSTGGVEGDDVARADQAPAAVSFVADRVRIDHRRLWAAIDPFAGHGVLRRDTSVGWPLEVTLRVALAARLPLEGGLALHAAGIVRGEEGFAFFGPSGAGKSTLAATAPGPVLSDEMIAVIRSPTGPGYRLASTGFWGALGVSPAPNGPFPLRALVELGKSPTFHVERLDTRTALRRLIPCALVPPGPPLWSAALAVMGRLTRRVPVFRMAWSPSELPWEALEGLGR
jgi:hypothetical protein